MEGLAVSILAPDIEVETEDVEMQLSEMEGRFKNPDPFLEWLAPKTEFAIYTNFIEQMDEAGPMAPLSPEYAAQKGRTHPGRQILQRDLSMLRSVSSEVVAGELLSGPVGIPYARFHQEGTGNMPRRNPFFFADWFIEQGMDWSSEWITEGRLPA